MTHCDISKRESINKFVKDFKNINLQWDTFISAPCNPLPLKAFFECNFEEWTDSIHVNAIEQLRILHLLHPYRNVNNTSSVVFFAGGGVNNTVINFSAYTISKIMLIKMCEYLDAENEDLNIFIVGPGWTKTKTHSLILEHTNSKDKKHIRTLNFMKNEEGTSMDDIHECIKWLCEQGKDIASGRNFSVVNDKFKNKNLTLELKSDPDMYKLRRYKNDWKPNQ